MTGRRFGQLVPEGKLHQHARELARRERELFLERNLADKEAIAAHYRLRLSETAFPKDGALVDDTIILRAFGTSEERRNFTFYHELTHHLIRQDDSFLSDIHDASSDPDRLIEQLCNAGAAEFLVPCGEVLSYTDTHGFSTSAIPELCGKFLASGIVVAIQMTVTASHECYLVIAAPVEKAIPPEQLRLDPWDDESHLALQIQYSAKSPSAKYSIARGTDVTHDHLIAQTYRQRCRTTGKAGIPFRTGEKMLVDCDCLYFRESVYGFFNVTPPIGIRPQRLL